MRIVVRAPNWLGDLVMALPFFHALREAYPRAETHVLVKGGLAPALSLLPEAAELHIHPYDKKNYRGYFGKRRFCRQMVRDIGRIDLYFALPPSVSAALIGFLLGAKERIGYRSQGRSPLMTKVYPWPKGLHRSEEYLGLLGRSLGRDLELPRWQPERLNHPFQLPFSSYYVLNCNSNASSRRLPVASWVDVLNLIEPSNFVLSGGPGEQDRVQQYQAELEAVLPQHRFHSIAGQTSVFQLIWVLQGAIAMLSNDSGPAHLGHMLGVRSVILSGAAELKNTGFSYAVGPSLMLEKKLSCAPCVKNVCPLGTIDCLRDFGPLLDSVPTFLKENNPITDGE